jgi:hypothetical protein
MAELIDGTVNISTIDNRILAAIERNQDYLGLKEWLGRYGKPAEKEPHDIVNR